MIPQFVLADTQARNEAAMDRTVIFRDREGNEQGGPYVCRISQPQSRRGGEGSKGALQFTESEWELATIKGTEVDASWACHVTDAQGQTIKYYIVELLGPESYDSQMTLRVTTKLNRVNQ